MFLEHSFLAIYAHKRLRNIKKYLSNGEEMLHTNEIAIRGYLTTVSQFIDGKVSNLDGHHIGGIGKLGGDRKN